MPKILTVARREFGEVVKTKTFLIGLLMPPVLMALIFFFTGRMEKSMTSGSRPTMVVVVNDRSGKIGGEIQNSAKIYNEAHPQRQIRIDLVNTNERELQEKVRQGKVSGALYIPPRVESGDACHFHAKMRSIGDEMLASQVGDFLNSAASNVRLRARGLSPELISELQRQIPVINFEVGENTAVTRTHSPAKMMIPLAFMFFMFMGIFSMSQQMLTTVIEEKNSRVMEMLLSALTPFQLMSGKILGMAAAGFVMVVFWGLLAFGVASSHGTVEIGNSTTFVCFAFYYVLGFLLFSSLFAAIGATCNSLKEAQNLMMPIMILSIMPIMAWPYFSQHPDGPVTFAFSMFPLTSPMVMMLRLAVRPETSLVQILFSVLLLAASVPAVMWASAKIFRTGVLMYGKPPTIRELVRWLRYK